MDPNYFYNEADAQPDSLNEWIKTVSFGKAWLVPTLVPWFEIGATKDSLCEFPMGLRVSWITTLTFRELDDEIDFSEFDRAIIITPRYDCPGELYDSAVSQRGKVPMPQDDAVISISVAADTTIVSGQLTHEFGHMLGLDHSSYLDCGDDELKQISGCKSLIYKDYFDVMGNPERKGHFNVFHLDKIGWIVGGINPAVKEIESSGHYILEPLEIPIGEGAQNSGVRALKIPIKQGENKGNHFYVDFRAHLGHDTQSFIPPASDLDGAFVYLVKDTADVLPSELQDNTQSVTDIFLLDMSPEGRNTDSNFASTVLKEGQEFFDRESGIKITPSKVNPGFFARVHVEYVCGNSHLDEGEQCDDGNIRPGDGCSDQCKIEVRNICPPGSECDPQNVAANIAAGIECKPDCTIRREYKVFVTSDLHNGNLGGFEGADAKCNAAATSVGLDGEWKAWLSSSEVNAKDRLHVSTTNIPYKTLRATTINDEGDVTVIEPKTIATSFNDLVSGSLQNPINVYENGDTFDPQDPPGYLPPPTIDRVITGTDAQGIFTGRSEADDCDGWTSNSGSGFRHGTIGGSGNEWTDSGLVFTGCTTIEALGRLYCFEQPQTQCGNGVLEQGEECDLGERNGQEGESCSTMCKNIAPEFIKICNDDTRSDYFTRGGDVFPLDFVRRDLNAKYKQICDIDLSGINHFPIGEDINPFTGKYDGNGFTISHMESTILGLTGLFGKIDDNATIDNVKLFNFTLKTPLLLAGGIAGVMDGSSRISNSNVQGKILGNGEVVGGMVGAILDLSVIENSNANVNITGKKDIGGLVGTMSEDSKITNSKTRGTISGMENLGGFAGSMSTNSLIKDSEATGDVIFTTLGRNVGGFVGVMAGDSKITNSNAIVNQTIGVTNVGAFVGTISGGNIILDSIAKGKVVKGDTYVGGFAGIMTGSEILSSTSDVDEINATGDFVGGFVGSMSGGAVVEKSTTGSEEKPVKVNGKGSVGGFVGKFVIGRSIFQSSARAEVTGTGSVVGGFAGDFASASIEESFAVGSAKGANMVGGFFGRKNGGTVKNAYATVDVQSYAANNNHAGGFVGSCTFGKIINSYSTGRVIAPASGFENAIGGFIGFSKCQDITSSYWDMDTSGWTTGCGTVDCDNLGRTNIDMKRSWTFEGWRFDTIWNIINGFSYPYFKWEEPETQPGIICNNDGICDPGESRDDCPADCPGSTDPTLLCGNGRLDTQVDEACEDGGRKDCNPYPGCSFDCKAVQQCGNGVTECGEQCDGETWCNSNCRNKTISSGGAVVGCVLESAQWENSHGVQISNAEDGEEVTMKVSGTNCDGQRLYYQIKENELGPDPLIKVVQGTYDSATWNAQWASDGFLQGNSEYYFVVGTSNGVATSENLDVGLRSKSGSGGSSGSGDEQALETEKVILPT